MYQNTIDMKKDTEISQSIALQLSLSRKEISLSLENADLSARLYTLMFLKLSLTRLSVMSENNSCSFDWHSSLYLNLILAVSFSVQHLKFVLEKYSAANRLK